MIKPIQREIGDVWSIGDDRKLSFSLLWRSNMMIHFRFSSFLPQNIRCTSRWHSLCSLLSFSSPRCRRHRSYSDDKSGIRMCHCSLNLSRWSFDCHRLPSNSFDPSQINCNTRQHKTMNTFDKAFSAVMPFEDSFVMGFSSSKTTRIDCSFPLIVEQWIDLCHFLDQQRADE